jgi:hypothetical protein
MIAMAISRAQWEQIRKAVQYGKSVGVDVKVTVLE